MVKNFALKAIASEDEHELNSALEALNMSRELDSLRRQLTAENAQVEQKRPLSNSGQAAGVCNERLLGSMSHEIIGLKEASEQLDQREVVTRVQIKHQIALLKVK